MEYTIMSYINSYLSVEYPLQNRTNGYRLCLDCVVYIRNKHKMLYFVLAVIDVV